MKRLSKKADVDQMCVLYARNADTSRTGIIEQYIAFGDWADHCDGPSVRFHGGTPFTGQLDNAPVMQFNIYGDCIVAPSIWMNVHNCPNVFDEGFLKRVTHFIQRNLPILYLVYERFLDKADALAYFEGEINWKTMLASIYRLPEELYIGILACENNAQLHTFCIDQKIYGEKENGNKPLLCSALEKQNKPVFELSWDHYGCTLCGYNGSSTTVYIPEDVTTIGENAFSNHSEIRKIVFNNAVEMIEEGAFAGCSGLEMLIIPGSVWHIASKAFAHCTGLRSAYIEEKIEWEQTLSEEAFYDCANLRDISLSDSVWFSGHPFGKCPQLQIICTPNSNAEEYALENGIPFIRAY